MAAEAVAAAFLAANKRVFFYHNRAHVFEPYGGLNNGHIVYLAQPVDHIGGSNGFYYGTALSHHLKHIKR